MNDTYTLVDQEGVEEAVAMLSEQPVVSIDTETEGLDPVAGHKLVLIQAATPTHVYLFPATLDLQPLVTLLNDTTILKLIQFAPFDFGFLYKYLGAITRPVWCTKQAEMNFTDLRKNTGLKVLSRKYLGIDLSKGEVRTSFKYGQEFTPEQLEYAAMDALVLFGIYSEQERLLRPGNKCPALMATISKQLTAEQDRIDRNELRVD